MNRCIQKELNMNSKRKILTPVIRASLLGLVILALVSSGWSGGMSMRAQDNVHFSPPFDFSDAFYLDNGIDPSKLIVRVGTPARPQNVWTLDNSNTDPHRNNIRALETASAFDIDGNLSYFNVMAVLDPSAFTNDPAGVRARTIADSFRAIFFPKTPRLANGDPGPVSLGLDRKSTRLNSSHSQISYAVFCLKKKTISPQTKCSGLLRPLNAAILALVNS